MLWLRRGWLYAIAGALVMTGGSALVMRYELLTPGPTLSPELVGDALGVHGMMAMLALAALAIAVPTLRTSQGRASVTLGAIALAVWGAAVVFLAVDPSRFGVRLLAASLAFGAAQLAICLREPRPLAAIAGLVAIAIVALPLFAGVLPTQVFWLAAATALAASVARDRSPFVLFTIAPCLVLAWAATALVHAIHTGYFQDTTAIVAPLPVTGGALLGVLLVAVGAPPRRLAKIAATLITAGTAMTSLGFFLLGSRGMPRRYLAYDPQFQPLHVVVGVAAVVAVAGCTAAAISVMRRRAV